MRLNRYIAQCGVASRRKADDLIAAGKVSVSGKTVTDFSYRVKEGDAIEVDGQPIRLKEETIVLAMNKPRGVTTTKSDVHAEKTVMDLLPKEYTHLNPAGRLDRESEGLLILTNDGELLNELTHPSFEHEKEYIVETEQPIHDKALDRLRRGIRMNEGHTGPNEVERLGRKRFSIVLRQGWKRQIRRMVEAVGNSVTMLQRVRVGKLELGTMKPGQYRTVSREDIV